MTRNKKRGIINLVASTILFIFVTVMFLRLPTITGTKMDVIVISAVILFFVLHVIFTIRKIIKE